MSQTPAQSPEGEPTPAPEAPEPMSADAGPESAPGGEAPVPPAAAEAAPAAPAKPGPLTDEQLKSQLETLLFITDHPLSVEDLRKLTKVKDLVRLATLVGEIRQKYEDQQSAIQVLEVAGGFQMATRPAHADLVRKLFADKMTMRLSTAAHETLAIIAYKQPLTRAEVEQIRGVDVIASLETLLEKRLVKVVGRKESVGRPLLYGTTADFMRHFGLASLEALPSLDEFKTEEPAGAPGGETPASAPAAEGETAPAGELPAEEAVPEPPVAADALPEGGQGDDASASSAKSIWPAEDEPPAQEPPASDPGSSES